LPEPPAVAEIPPLVGGALVDLLAELDARGVFEVAAESLREDLRQLLGIPSALVPDVPHGVGLGEDRVAVAARVEHLAVDVRRAVARQVNDDRRDVVGVAAGPDRPLARPLAGLPEDPAAARRRVDPARGAARPA